MTHIILLPNFKTADWEWAFGLIQVLKKEEPNTKLSYATLLRVVEEQDKERDCWHPELALKVPVHLQVAYLETHFCTFPCHTSHSVTVVTRKGYAFSIYFFFGSHSYCNHFKNYWGREFCLRKKCYIGFKLHCLSSFIPRGFLTARLFKTCCFFCLLQDTDFTVRGDYLAIFRLRTAWILEKKYFWAVLSINIQMYTLFQDRHNNMLI